jgi:hypothetical protein
MVYFGYVEVEHTGVAFGGSAAGLLDDDCEGLHS